MIKDQVFGLLIGLILTTISYGFGLYFHWTDSINWLEAFTVFTSYWSTYLFVIQTRTSYIFGLISVLASILLYYQSNLLSSMMFNIYLVPVMFWGWFRWGKDSDPRPVTFIALKWWPVYIVGTAVTGLVMWWINTLFGGSNAFWDTTILALSVLAQYGLDNKKIENWVFWLIGDIISVFVYWHQGLIIVAIQMGLFTFNALWGLYEWRKTQKVVVGYALHEMYISDPLIK